MHFIKKICFFSQEAKNSCFTFSFSSEQLLIGSKQQTLVGHKQPDTNYYLLSMKFSSKYNNLWNLPKRKNVHLHLRNHSYDGY